MKIVEKDGAARFEVLAKPKAKKSRVLGARGDAFEIAIAAPPVDGAANEELIRFLARQLGVRQRDVRVVRGESSRTKLLEVTSFAPLTIEDLHARLTASIA